MISNEDNNNETSDGTSSSNPLRIEKRPGQNQIDSIASFSTTTNGASPIRHPLKSTLKSILGIQQYGRGLLARRNFKSTIDNYKAD